MEEEIDHKDGKGVKVQRRGVEIATSLTSFAPRNDGGGYG